MLTSLAIKNYALIEELEMTPSSKLNIITGETGAGKSIMLGAVGLLIGNRNDSKALFQKDKKCIVEGVFDISGYKLEQLFASHEVDFDHECIIRREINPTGKSRAFVNDTPVTLPFLKELGSALLDVHSQHESLNLGDKTYQLKVLDAFAAHAKHLTNYQAQYSEFTELKAHHDHLVEMANKGAEDADYNQYLLEELDAAQLDSLDQNEVEEELKRLENTEDIKLKLTESSQLLDGENGALLEQMNEVRRALESISEFSEEIRVLYSRVEEQRLELQDVSNEIIRLADQTDFDPERALTIKESLSNLYRLQKKHNTIDVHELIRIREDLRGRLNLASNIDQEIEKAKELYLSSEKRLHELGNVLTESRKLSALDLAAEIEKLIHKIGIENGHIEINIQPISPTKNGLDVVQMLFSANKGITPQEVSEVASGGEFSRLIFAIKYLIAGKTALPTIIFDEIDTGVSGEVALQMVQMMKEMAQNHQVISISHLPQFAAGGDAHYFVYKDHSSDRSISKIRKLENDDRVTEIAKMIGGQSPSKSAYSSARELLGIS